MKEIANELADQYDFDERVQLSILALLFRDTRFITEASHVIKPEYFEKDSFKYVCRWAYEFYKKYKKPPAFETFINYSEEKLGRLKRKSREEKDEVRTTVEDVYQIETPDPDYIRDCAVNFAKRRSFLERMEQALELAEQDKISEAVGLVRGVERIELDTSPAIDYFKKTVAVSTDKRIWEKVKSGLGGIDFVTGGIKQKQYGCLAMVTGTGKTTTLVNLARSYAKRGKNILLVPNEQDEAELQSLLDCSILGMSQNKRYKANSSKSKLRDIRKRVRQLQKLWGGNIFMKYLPFNEGRVSQIESHVEKLEATKGLVIDGIIVDSLDGLTSDYDSQWDNEVACFKEFERLLGTRNKWGWTAVQVDIKSQGASEESRHITRLGQLRGRADKVFLSSLAVALNVTQPAEYKRGKFTKSRGFMCGLKTRNTYVGLRCAFSMDTNLVRIYSKRPGE